MRFFEKFLLSLSFLSRIPLKLPERYFSDDSLKSSVVFFPAVGYLPGLIYLFLLSFGDLLSRFFALVVVFWLFDLFHFDGLLDTLDGFLNQSNKEKRLEIMSKGNVGPFAVFFGMLYVVLLWELTSLVEPVFFLVAAVLGRWGMNVLLTFSKPAKTTGLAFSLYPTRKLYAVLALFFTIPLVFVCQKCFFVFVLIVFAFSMSFSKISNKKIGGITGDVLGASCMINQLLILLAAYVINEI
ncbi:adenosylcobinamide-GDP ribazoletransferase [Pseudothermotoga thermarum]|uniref:Adenosylcobinamide-GDP ribazoletransferase n=1 Tax=Pseudothermotoga thermarum DSM 5069 TaxID=688269 RepID=F7YVV9_9THEM|nr:adenosylcobinamide-GDP ribazoletransferase [Pseudothermotoga thermarum]AEH51781.1 cobalamin-5-phosphate synthase CobS [Pseudothermotoga thermarum DSM 5069]